MVEHFKSATATATVTATVTATATATATATVTSTLICHVVFFILHGKGKGVPMRAMKHMGEWSYRSTHS